jgi:hypothetical protein
MRRDDRLEGQAGRRQNTYRVEAGLIRVCERGDRRL